MKIILIENCSECPHVERHKMGQKLVCGQPSIKVKRPYSSDRVVSDMRIPEYCPLNNHIDFYKE